MQTITPRLFVRHRRGFSVAYVVALPLIFAALAGCESTARVEPLAARSIDSGDSAEVLRAAEVIFRREFGPVTVDRARGKITALPVEFQSNRETGAAREFVGAPSQMRRSGTCFVQKQGDATVVRVRIDVERRDTDRRDVQTAVMANDADRLTDTPNYSGVERGVARTAEQNEVWTHVRRDAALERSILDEIRNRFAPLETLGVTEGAGRPTSASSGGASQ